VTDLYSTDPIGAMQMAHGKLDEVQQEIGRFVFGQDETVRHTLTAILAGGHLLLVGVPGLAKTLLVSVVSKTLGFETKRIQCTPDLMPNDIVGTEVLEEVDYGRRNFRFVPGPIFCQFLMVDEINRASPRTQSALLQAMQEHNVTISGREYALPEPFHVLATQNPLELEGTYPLPEAQLDRFLIQVSVDYPSYETEKQIARATFKKGEDIPKSIIFINDLREIQSMVKSMPVSDKLLDALLTLVRNGRPGTSKLEIVNQYVSWGPGPRATQAISLCMCAHALLAGRYEPTMEDLHALIRPVLLHRMSLNYMARTDNVSINDVLKAMTETIAHG
jgi:MoxR-like ATPase